MKTIVIIGDSWGCGEWQRATEPPGTQQQIISHPGLAKYLIDDGYNVVNLSQFSEGNHKLLDPLKYFVEVNQYLNIEHIFFIQTDITRSLADRHLNLDDLALTHTHLVNVVSQMYYHFYSRLNHNAMLANCTVNLIGGLTDLLTNIGKFKNLNFLVPSWVKLIDSSAVPAQLVDHINMEHIISSWKNKTEILPYLEQSSARFDIFRNNPEYFWPDGSHPNRHGHKLLHQHLQSLGLLN
jgi:hypothetical protein